MKDYMKMLARKGAVTIVEHVGGKTMVAIQLSCGNIVTLEGGTKDRLLAELYYMCKGWPDIIHKL
jgi:hypothetical protein